MYIIKYYYYDYHYSHLYILLYVGIICICTYYIIILDDNYDIACITTHYQEINRLSHRSAPKSRPSGRKSPPLAARALRPATEDVVLRWFDGHGRIRQIQQRC